MSPTDLQARLVRRGQHRLASTKTQPKRRSSKKPETVWSLTFPDRLKSLAERLYREALIHPFWAGQSPDAVRQSVAHRLWSYLEANTAPWWYGGCPVPKSHEATPAQLEALKSAREARAAEAHERELRFNARLEAAQV